MYFRSFFQALCVIGYCLLPSVFSAITCKALHIMADSNLVLIFRLLATGTAFFWSVYGREIFFIIFFCICALYLKWKFFLIYCVCEVYNLHLFSYLMLFQLLMHL